MPFGLGFGETVLIFLVLILLFGAGKIPEIGGALGKGIRDFKAALSDREDENRMYRAPSPPPPLAPPDEALPLSPSEAAPEPESESSSDADRKPSPTYDD